MVQCMNALADKVQKQDVPCTRKDFEVVLKDKQKEAVENH